MWKLLISIVSLLLVSIVARAQSVNLTFENLTDLESVTNQYESQGVNFANTVALRAGFTLNELNFPPHSGQIVIADDLVAPINISFTSDVQGVSAWFSYASPVAIDAYDSIGNLLGRTSSGGSSLLGGSEQIIIAFSGVRSLSFAGSAIGSYVLDDLIFTPSDIVTTPVPEPTTNVLIAIGLVALLSRAKGQTRHSKRGRK